MKMKIINTTCTRNPMKETRPDERPRANILALITEQLGRNSVGSHSTYLPFNIIHCPCLMKISRFI